MVEQGGDKKLSIVSIISDRKKRYFLQTFYLNV